MSLGSRAARSALISRARVYGSAMSSLLISDTIVVFELAAIKSPFEQVLDCLSSSRLKGFHAAPGFRCCRRRTEAQYIVTPTTFASPSRPA